MSEYEKILIKLLKGGSDQNFEFDELLFLLQRFDFEVRVSGSHHIFYKKGVIEIINLQPNGSKAKAYQVKQVRIIIQKYGLTL